MKQILKYFSIFLFLFAFLPSAIGGAMIYNQGWAKSWRTASWDSSGVLPVAATVDEAEVIILSARTGRWKGIFAEHMSIVLKARGAPSRDRYEVVGWGKPVRKNNYADDARWYGNEPRVVYRLAGAEAEALIPKIEATIAGYPFSQRGDYTVWPGPNSNTFVAHVVRNTDGFAAELPPAAVGKDWLGWIGVADAPSKTGWSASIAGVFGLTTAVEEGLEFHFLGSTIGVDFNDLAIKLPALGKIGV